MRSIFASLLLASTVLGAVIEQRSSRTSPPSGCLTVKSSGAQYTTIQAAVSALGAGSSSSSACIFIYPGTYKEKLKINSYKGTLVVYGSTSDTSSYLANSVTVTWGDTAAATGGDEQSSTIDVTVANFKMYNVNIINSYGAGLTSGQAIALTAKADKLSFYGCAFTSYQDTLYAKSGYQYYKKCLIIGAVDYIFGDATAWFEQCTLQSNGGGAITAQNRGSASETTWYIFNKCTVEAASNWKSTGANFLGRPWGIDSRVTYQYCTLSNIINSAGWTTMVSGATPYYYEYQNTGAGSSTSSRKYLTKTTAALTQSGIFSAGTSWIDSSY